MKRKPIFAACFLLAVVAVLVLSTRQARQTNALQRDSWTLTFASPKVSAPARTNSVGTTTNSPLTAPPATSSVK